MTYIFNSFRINPPCLLRRKMKESHGTEPLTCGSWNFWVTIVRWNRIKNTQLVSGNCLVVWKTHTHIHWEAELQVKLLTLILSSLYGHLLSHPVLQFSHKRWSAFPHLLIVDSAGDLLLFLLGPDSSDPHFLLALLCCCNYQVKSMPRPASRSE